MTPPCRCLLDDFPEGKELAELIADYVASLPEELRAAPEEISRRLNVCRDCAELFDGTCRLCGCYVEARAAKAGMGCPAVPPRWEAVPPSIERSRQTCRICRCSFQLLHPVVFPAGFCFALPHAKKH